MREAHVNTPVPLYWKTPFIGGDDPVISDVAREFVVAKHGGPYSIGEIIAFLRKHVPVRRAQIIAAEKAALRRKHETVVTRLTAAA